MSAELLLRLLNDREMLRDREKEKSISIADIQGTQNIKNGGITSPSSRSKKNSTKNKKHALERVGRSFTCGSDYGRRLGTFTFKKILSQR